MEARRREGKRVVHWCGGESEQGGMGGEGLVDKNERRIKENYEGRKNKGGKGKRKKKIRV
jgi:hypothetical protein